VLDTRLRWTAAAPDDAALRRRVEAEVREVSWTLSQLQALVHDASLVASPHAYLLPRMEVRLPLYDAGLRYRVRIEHVDGPKVSLVDDAGARVADVVLI
jgi:hypothetical protein